jgi:hypothetical protein
MRVGSAAGLSLHKFWSSLFILWGPFVVTRGSPASVRNVNRSVLPWKLVVGGRKPTAWSLGVSTAGLDAILNRCCRRSLALVTRLVESRRPPL